jgi:histidinol phosphatase-like PHP family hydrolase|tara:strand:+ start:102 stop:494 length:393 start_codon:yes stop_codon:yes gene_type:complete
MKTEKLKEKYLKYGLEKADVFKHQHYRIITRSGIEKIAAIENILIHYEVVKCETNFAAVKAIATKDTNTIETYGSALKGNTFKEGNTNSWYVLEMAQKRSFSRAVLQLTGMYELGVFGEDESEDFKKSNN